MQATRSSETADFVTALRAIHQREQGGYILSDPYAEKLTSWKWRLVLANKYLCDFYFRYLCSQSLNSSGAVFARQRYCEDLLAQAAQEEAQQYLLLGAGMDSFVFRRADLLGKVMVFELDHPATQAEKRRRIAASGLKNRLPVEYLPIDFQCQTLGEVLENSTFDRSKPTFVAWLGVTYYLSTKAIADTLANLAHICLKRADIVFDYIDKCLFDRAFLEAHPDIKAGFDAFIEFTEQSGEPLLSGFDKTSLVALLHDNGWRLKEHLDGEEMAGRYFKGERDNTWPSKYDFFVHCQTTSLSQP